MDRIFLKQLAVPAIIGIHEHEQLQPQTIWLDLEAQIDASKAAATDHIASTVDYSAIYRYLKDFIPTTRFQLLETLAAVLADQLLHSFSLSWLRLTITKKPQDLSAVTGVGVIIERGR
ncbi:MAG: dihydroneopterin aldolase [Proteobacteria bacterium]|nr:dihydroneopterin aldolase [Pseudomonadota bacterium]